MQLYLLIVCILFNKIINSEIHKPSIIIIGAGSSGIAAATKLYENNFTHFKVLEHDFRIGGRINTEQFGDNVIDLGAQWCHGTENNVVYQLALPLGYLDEKNEILDINRTQCIESNGNVLSSDLMKKNYEFFNNLLSSPELEEYTGTLEQFFIERYQSFAKSLNMTDELTQEFLNLFELFICADYSMDNWTQLNGIAYAAFEESAGFKLINWNGNGYKTILDILMKKHSDSLFSSAIRSKIELQKSVVNINYNNTNDKVTITTFDGHKYEADKVIVTVSLGVLKESYETLFEPRLPEWKELAINKLSYGVVNKVFLEFETKWWSNDWQGFQILWRSEDLKEMEKYNSWLSSLLDFQIVEHQSKTLMAWICGAKTKLFETLSDEIIKQDLMNLLIKLLGKTYNISKLIGFRRTTWYSQPNFKGTYSYRGIDAYKFNITNNDLAKPITNQNGKNVIFFAGEATNDIHFSTVHGAIESGWRAAQEIIDEIPNI